MSEIAEEKQLLYQWLKTDHAGQYSYQVGIEEEDDMTFIIFDNGERVNVDLVGEVVTVVDSTEDGFIIKKEVVNDITITKGLDGVEYEIPGPSHGKTITKKIPKPKKAKIPRKVSAKKPEPVVESDPVLALLERAKKTVGTYDVELKFQIIPNALYAVVTDNFEGGEDKALDYIVSLIDIDALKSQLKDKLKSVYNNG
jgi:hypothetical protein